MANQELPKYDLQELADSLLAVLEGAPDLFARMMKLQKLLLEGLPLSPERIAARLQVAREEVPALIQGAELDTEGKLIGWGLSLAPTPHSYQINGRQFYVWCAGDAITFPLLHKTSAVIASPDPISGEIVRLIGTPDGARDVEPSTAVVSWVRRPSATHTLETVRAWLCNFTNFFASMETASLYVSKHPGLVIVPIDDVFQMGKLLWEGELYKSITADL